MSESKKTYQLLQQLNRIGLFIKTSERFTKGIPDIIGVYRGISVWIEAKTDSKFKKLQVYYLQECVKNGGIAFGVIFKGDKTYVCEPDAIVDGKPSKMKEVNVVDYIKTKFRENAYLLRHQGADKPTSRSGSL